MAEQDLISLVSPPLAVAPAPRKEGPAEHQPTMTTTSTPVAAAEASPILPLFTTSPAPPATTTTAVAPLPAKAPLQTPVASLVEASPILPLLSPSPAPAKQQQAAAVAEASPILPLLSPSPAPAKPPQAQQAAAVAAVETAATPVSSASSASSRSSSSSANCSKASSLNLNLTPLALAAAASPTNKPPTISTPSSNASSSSAASGSSTTTSSSSSPHSPTASPRSAGSNSSGPRSKSPLPPRPVSASNSPPQRQSASAETSYLSPTASSAARSKPAVPSPRAESPKLALGGLQEIKEEETEEDVDVDIEVVAEAIARRMMPRGATRSAGSAAEEAAAGGATKKPPTPPAQQQQYLPQQQLLRGGAQSPAHERLHDAKLQKDLVDPTQAFMTPEHTFRPKRATEGTEEQFEHAAPPDQEYRRARSIFDRLYEARVDKDDYYRQAEELRLQKEVVGCSFAPRLVTDEFNREHVKTEARAGPVHQRLYEGVYDKQDYYRHYEEVKAHLETQDCTFVPAILETPTVDEEVRAALPIWERLHMEQTERASRKEHRRLAFEEQAKAKMPFKPAILETTTTASAAGEASEAESEDAAALQALPAHERLHKKGELMRKRKEERLRQLPYGCTFAPQLVAQDTLEGQRKSAKERTEEMYRHGKERVMRDLQRDMAKRPPKPRSNAEECTFFPQTNHLKKKT